MRHLSLVLLLTGCPAGGTAGPTNNTTNPASGCEAAGTEYVVASAGSFQSQQFLLDGLGILVDFGGTTTCVRSDGGGAAWLFQVNGEDYGLFRAEAMQAGSVTPTATNFVLDLYGATPTAIRYTGTDYAGVFTITSVSPTFSVAINGTASGGGRNAIVQFAMSATP